MFIEYLSNFYWYRFMVSLLTCRRWYFISDNLLQEQYWVSASKHDNLWYTNHYAVGALLIEVEGKRPWLNPMVMEIEK